MKNMKKNSKVALIVCLLLVVCVASIGGTIAWLQVQTTPVENTFTSSDVSITLTETKPGTNGGSAKMVPGLEIAKDPKVTVVANSEPCWVFVKIEKNSNTDKFLTYTIDSKWQSLPGVDGVYYIQQNATEGNTVVEVKQEYNILANNKVTVNTDITKADMSSLNESNQPKLKFTAYAIQQHGMSDVADAWEKLNPTNP